MSTPTMLNNYSSCVEIYHIGRWRMYSCFYIIEENSCDIATHSLYHVIVQMSLLCN